MAVTDIKQYQKFGRSRGASRTSIRR